MTTLRHYPEYERIDAALRLVVRRWWWVRLAQGGLIWLAGSGLLLMALAGVSGFVNLSPAVRLAMLIMLLGGPGLGAVVLVIRPMCRRLTPAQAARRIEQKLAGQENRFINAVQLAANGDLFEPELVRRTIDEIAQDTSGVPVEQAVTTGRLLLAGLAATLVGGLLVMFLVLAPDRFGYGLQRLIAHESRGWVGRIRIDEVRPGNVPGPLLKSALLPGDKLTIEARVSTAEQPQTGYEPAGRLWLRREGEASFTAFEMKSLQPVGRWGAAGADGIDATYRRELVVDRSFEYYVSVGDTDQSDNPYRVQVSQTPLVAELQVQPVYPEYLRYEQPKAQSDGDLDVPLGAKATVSVRLNRAVNSAEAEIIGPSGRAIPMLDQGGRTSWSAPLPLLRTMQYRLVFRDRSDGSAAGASAAKDAPIGTLPSAAPIAETADQAAPAPFFNITTRPDYPPAVQILRPGPNAMVKPGGTIDVVIQASDDHGLTGLRLLTAALKSGVAATGPDQASGATNFSAGDLGPVEVQNSWTTNELAGGTGGLPASEDTGGPLNAARAKPEDGPAHGHPPKLVKKTATLRVGEVEGERLVLWAEATDNRDLSALATELGLADGGGPQTATSTKLIITVADPEKIAAMQKQALDQLLAEINALLAEQTNVQTVTLGLSKPAPNVNASAPDVSTEVPNVNKESLKRIAEGQGAFFDHLLRLAKGRIVKFTPETEPVQLRLLVLAYNDASTAKALADALAAEGQNQVKHSKLLGCQDRIIRALQALLGLIGQAEKRGEQTTTRPEDTNLPAEGQDPWKKLAGDLGEFIKQQAKDIAALQSLAKKPVDDFARDQALKDLAANEDKWEKLLADKISDFSKLAEQDFSNPDLLMELIQLKTDVVMAKDALQKKAAEIAVPLEESGLELAETLTAHIEKWLPDTPDREKWTMEEPTDQKDVPMAELPKELEDMVGELLEQEEDLFDQMQDATSKWTDSLDKGAGWDAADGPISNMSAQGVTGNQLPNSSEISGRSGEGRTGKASGEMVGDQAVGKGGRNTPTRLGNDPFQKGQVQDTSKEPPGGATGGGKVSGLAGEGLQGPVPPGLAKDLQRLAGKQAAVRNQAEAVDARFKANNFNNFALEKTLTLMRLAGQDLENYRYQNALRKTAVVVNNLQAQKMLLHGDIVVQADKSPELPAVSRKDIRNIDDNDLPPRYKELAKEYIKSLSDEAGQAAAPVAP